MLIIRLLIIIIGLFGFTQPTNASDDSGPGVSFTYPLIVSEPENLHGYRASIFYQPERLIWPYIKLYFDASFGHWWDYTKSNDAPTNGSLDIYSIAPVVRVYYKNSSFITPFIDLSIGFSYLTETRIYKRNLGMHFSFQDQLALGASFGKRQQFSVSMGGLHYSNGSLCNRNSGMTIPLFINVGYRF